MAGCVSSYGNDIAHAHLLLGEKFPYVFCFHMLFVICVHGRLFHLLMLLRVNPNQRLLLG